MRYFSRRRSLVLTAIAAPFTGFYVSAFAGDSNTNAKITAKIASVGGALKKLEAVSHGRLGIAAINTGSGMRIDYRAEERFPFCSTFKTIVAAAILKQSESDKALLQTRIRYSQDDLLKSGYAPITQKYLTDGMTVAELCAATLQYSDNAAANFLMQELGGPAAVTAYARSIGDDIFRLDRWEPGLNSAIPGDERDTTTPTAMAKSVQRLALGDALSPPQRAQLVAWLKGNTTGGKRILAGVPSGWIVGDKTGTGSFGTTNDAGVLWPANGGAPIVAVIYFTQNEQKAAPRDDVIAAATRLIVDALQ